MSPTIVLNGDGIPVLTCGAAGGPKIINATLQVILRCLDLGQNIDDALAAPRIHHQWRPDQITHEPTLPTDIVEGLTKMGILSKAYEQWPLPRVFNANQNTYKLQAIHVLIAPLSASPNLLSSRTLVVPIATSRMTKVRISSALDRAHRNSIEVYTSGTNAAGEITANLRANPRP